MGNSSSDEKFQLWGTFSVFDHLKPGAFLSEVVMYDQLVIPVPPILHGEASEEEQKAVNEQLAIWRRERDPARLDRLLEILGDCAMPVEWTPERHKMWAAEYEKSKLRATGEFSRILAGYVTGENLLSMVSAMAEGVVAAAPYTSLADLERDLGIKPTSPIADRVTVGRDLPAGALSTVIGREFLVPEDPDKDEFYLLREAVDLVHDQDYREARQLFHSAQQKFLREGKTDLVSVQEAVGALSSHLATLDKLARKRRFWNGLRRGFFFAQITVDLLAAPVNPLSLGHAAIAVGQFSTSERLASSNAQHDVRPGGALLLDAQRRLKLTLEGERRR